MTARDDETLDVAIVGGGLAGGLGALALAARAPQLKIAVVEAANEFCGNHTWCCHRSDVDLWHEVVAHEATPKAAHSRKHSPWEWLDPLIPYRWDGHVVRFPAYARSLTGAYVCLTSAHLRQALENAVADGRLRALLGVPVRSADRHNVHLASGRTLRAQVVLDARGGAAAHRVNAGWQKFIGWEIRLPDPGPHIQAPSFDRLPLLMDATVAQSDGYRFMYVLPFSPTHLLVEDTSFSITPQLDAEGGRARLRSYLEARGVREYAIEREETGVLPMPWTEPENTAGASGGAIPIGYRGGFFQPATGYSFGLAVTLAERVALAAGHAAGQPAPALAAAVGAAVKTLRTELHGDRQFAQRLNALAFRAARAHGLRAMVFAPVYQLKESVLQRFYAARTTGRDRLAILAAAARLSWLVRSDTPTVAAREAS